MPRPPLESLLARLAQTPLVWWGIWFGLLLLTLGLLLLMRTQWGQSQPLRKCVALSLLAHLLLAGYATTVQIVHATMGPQDRSAVRVSSVNLEASENPSERGTPKAWETFADATQSVDTPAADRPDVDAAPSDVPPEASATPAPASPTNDRAAADPVQPADALAETEPHALQRDVSPESATPLDDAPGAQRAEAPAPTVEPAESLAKPQTDRGDEAPEVDRPQTALDPLVGALSSTAELPTTADPASILADVNDRFARDSSPVPAADAAEAAAQAGQSSADAHDDSSPLGAAASGGMTAQAPAAGDPHLPEIYRGRLEHERGALDAASGATAETEQAVEAALRWLANNQSPDGRWDAQRFGAGTERHELGPTGRPQDRQQAGAKADTGVTGLALLAFLGAGHTHRGGEYRQTVGRGLDFLLASQRADGNLGGESTIYAFMYCHGMATFALSEAYAMTGDRRLEQPLRRAIEYTLNAQHPTSGGWRYRPWRERPGDAGDMSQLGWQLMALKSAALAGIDVPPSALDKTAKFIRSVSFGTHGGLASYRIGEQASRIMTAEALASRQFLGIAGDNPTTREATQYILGELPGEGQANLYYWYYASLAMHNIQGREWETWNAALRRSLLDTQETEGPLAGTWPTDSTWAGYGGRVYTAAMGALCLEVYYRYLPIYLEATAKGARVR